MTILITDGVGKGKLGMVTIFCHSDQAKLEPLVMFPTLVQWDSHELAMVMMKIFTNSPYIPQGSFGLSFLDVATLLEGASTIQFPLPQLHLCQLLLYSSTQVILPKKEKEANELKITLITQQTLWESSIEEHHVSSLVLLLLPQLVPATSLITYEDRGAQTDER